MREISKIQFEAYFYRKAPIAQFIINEVAWFEAFNKKILAVITYDKIDSDFGYVILGRDSNNLFRAIETSLEFYKSKNLALEELKKAISKYENDGNKNYPQGDEQKTPNKILEALVEDSKLHPNFRLLINNDNYEAARNLIKEIAYSFYDVDGNYIKDFQSTGFDSRLWELFLHVYFYYTSLDVKREHEAPDFQISSYSGEIFIEALTVNPTQNNERLVPDAPETLDDVKKINQDFMPIKFGSALYSKLKKEYWKLPHVSGKPLIFAIHDYHNSSSMTWSHSALHQYLYGIRVMTKTDENGKQIEYQETISEHSWEGKVIPSNFFEQDDTENISGVLFTNAATIPKFNRMGKLAGLGSEHVKMVRSGFMYNPVGDEPLYFSQDIDDPTYEETWSDGLILYHNPNAKSPIDPTIFPNITHAFQDPTTKKFHTHYQNGMVFSSLTITISPKKES